MDEDEFEKLVERFISNVKKFSLKEFLNRHKGLITSLLLPTLSLLIVFYNIRSNNKIQERLLETQYQLKDIEITTKDKREAYSNFNQNLYLATQACFTRLRASEDEPANVQEQLNNLMTSYYKLEPYLTKEVAQNMDSLFINFTYDCKTRDKNGSFYKDQDKIRGVILNDILLEIR